jgi:hypothetical protein
MTITLISPAFAAVPMGTAARHLLHAGPYAGRLLLAVFSVTMAILLQRDVSDQGQMIQFVRDLTLTGRLSPVVSLGACTLGLDTERHA